MRAFAGCIAVAVFASESLLGGNLPSVTEPSAVSRNDPLAVLVDLRAEATVASTTQNTLAGALASVAAVCTVLRLKQCIGIAGLLSSAAWLGSALTQQVAVDLNKLGDPQAAPADAASLSPMTRDLIDAYFACNALIEEMLAAAKRGEDYMRDGSATLGEQQLQLLHQYREQLSAQLQRFLEDVSTIDGSVTNALPVQAQSVEHQLKGAQDVLKRQVTGLLARRWN